MSWLRETALAWRRKATDPIWLLVRTFVVIPFLVVLCVVAAVILAIIHLTQRKGP